MTTAPFDDPVLTSIDDLRPAPYNPRRISAKAASALAKSLGDYGDLSGIVWNKRTGHLVCGHQRVEQLRKAGVQLVGDALASASGERFPVRVVDWPIAREKAANLVANNPAIAGEFTERVISLLDEVREGIGAQSYANLLIDSIREARAKGFRRGEGSTTSRLESFKGEEDMFAMPEWLRQKWEEAKILIVQYSGGKDSSGAALFAAHNRLPHQELLLCFTDPGVEFPGLGAHIVDVAEALNAEPVVVKPTYEWWSWLRRQGEWPSLLFRPCAQKFVHEPFAKFVKKHDAGTTILMTGSRAEEAVRGSKKTENSPLLSLGKDAEVYQHFAPMFAVKKATLESAIAASGLPLWEGYSRGFVRTACWCCPGQCGLQAAALMDNYPGLAEDIRRWEKRLGPMQPQGSAGPVSFDTLVERGRRQREKAAAKTEAAS